MTLKIWTKTFGDASSCHQKVWILIRLFPAALTMHNKRPFANTCSVLGGATIPRDINGSTDINVSILRQGLRLVSYVYASPTFLSPTKGQPFRFLVTVKGSIVLANERQTFSMDEIKNARGNWKFMIWLSEKREDCAELRVFMIREKKIINRNFCSLSICWLWRKQTNKNCRHCQNDCSIYCTFQKL